MSNTPELTAEVKHIRGKLRSQTGYWSLVDGVSTFDTAAIFDDMRILLKALDTRASTSAAAVRAAKRIAKRAVDISRRKFIRASVEKIENEFAAIIESELSSAGEQEKSEDQDQG